MLTFTVNFNGEVWSVSGGGRIVLDEANERAAMCLALDLASKAFDEGHRAQVIVVKANDFTKPSGDTSHAPQRTS